MAVYEISTVSELKAFRDLVNSGTINADAKLMNDIDLAGNASDQWTPIGDYNTDKSYAGTFDGNGFTISGIYINVGTSTSLDDEAFIGQLDATGTIKNLILSGSIVGGFWGVAGFVGECYGTVNNCINKITVTSMPDTSVDPEEYLPAVDTIGGIVAYAYDGSSVINCINEGAISGFSNVGGIIGANEPNTTTLNNINTGAIYGFSNVGGIIGNLDGAELYNCVNEGNITSTTDGTYNGGICGWSSSRSTWSGQPCHSLINNCVNTGNISCGDSTGGIVGVLAVNSTISYCVNEGTVVGTTKVGAVVGDRDGTLTSSYYLDTSSNTGIGVGSGTGTPTSYTIGNAPAVSCIIKEYKLNTANNSTIISPTIYPYYNSDISTVAYSSWTNDNTSVANVSNDTISFISSGVANISVTATFTLNSGSVSMGNATPTRFLYIVEFTASGSETTIIPRDFTRYILDGNTNNYNVFNPNATTSKINTRHIKSYEAINTSHFLINNNNYFFFNSNNYIKAYTNTDVLYYTTTNQYTDIDYIALGNDNNIYIKYNTNKLECMAVLGNMLNTLWSITDSNIGNCIAFDDNYIYVNSIINKNSILVINPRLINDEYTVKTITINSLPTTYTNNTNRIIKDIVYNGSYLYCLLGTTDSDNISYICKIDLYDDSTKFVTLVSDNITKVTSNLCIVNNIIYYAKNNIIYHMSNGSTLYNLEVFNSGNITKISSIDDEYIYVMTDNNKIAIIDIYNQQDDLGTIIYNYDNSSDTDNTIIDLHVNKKDKAFYLIYNDKIDKVYPSLIIDSNGIIGSQCYKFNGGNSYIEFDTISISPNNISMSINYKPTNTINNRSVLVGGYNNYDWQDICWSDSLDLYCSIAKNNNVSSVMIGNCTSNWYTTNEATLPVSTWNSICWDKANHKFVVISYDNVCAYSSDGLTWSLSVTPPTTYKWNKIYFADELNNLYILQQNSNIALYSLSVTGTWKELTLPVVSDWKDMSYRNSDKLLVFINGTNTVYSTVYNSNVINSIVVGDIKWTNITYSKELDKFILIAKGSNIIAMSSDCANWTLIELPYSDNWSAVIYDDKIFNKFFIFSEFNNAYLSSTDGVNWKIREELDYNYNIKSVAISNNTVCALINDADITFNVLDGTDIIIDNKYQFANKFIFNRNITQSTNQLYFDATDKYLYVLYSNYKLRTNFKMNCDKIDEWHNIIAVFNGKNVKVFANNDLVGNFNIPENIYDTNSNTSNIIHFNLSVTNNIYKFRIGNAILNNNLTNELYGYVNDFILFDSVITPKEIDDINKIKVLHCKFNYNYTDSIYDNIIHDISCYNHDFTGNPTYSADDNAYLFKSSDNAYMIDNKYKLNNDKFTLSFWFKNDGISSSKILMSNYTNENPYILLLAKEFKPSIDLPINLVQSTYSIKEHDTILYANNWEQAGSHYGYVITDSDVNVDSVIDILPSINISDLEFESLVESGIKGYNQLSDGSYILRAYDSKPTVDIPIRTIIRSWDESSMSLNYVNLTANNWSNSLYTVTAGIQSTDTIEILIGNDLTDSQYNALISADIRGYSQSNGSFVLKAYGITPIIDIPVIFYINSTVATTSNKTLLANEWVGNKIPYSYKIYLDNTTANIINVMPAESITDNEMNILKSSAIRDGGWYGANMNGWVISYIPVSEDSLQYSLFFNIINNDELIKIKIANDNSNIDYNIWNNYIITYNNGIFNTYINGIPQRVENYNNSTNDTNLIIGSANSVPEILNTGSIYGSYSLKDIRIYHNVLNNNSIQEIINKGNILNSNGDLYTYGITENNSTVDISSNGISAKSFKVNTNTDPDSEYIYDILINTNYGTNKNEVLIKGDINEKL